MIERHGYGFGLNTDGHCRLSHYEREEIEASADSQVADASPGPFGMAVATIDSRMMLTGATDLFPDQTISKIFVIDLALRTLENQVFDRVGREPSGDPFNSLVDRGRNCGTPRNPFINAGDLLVGEKLVESHGAAARDAVMELIRKEISARSCSTRSFPGTAATSIKRC